MIIKSLPFFWRITDTPRTPVVGIPETMNLEFEVHSDTGLVRQRVTRERLAVLEHAYHRGADVGYLNLEADQRPVSEFLDFISEMDAFPKKVLEIGSGGGAVAKRLTMQGSQVTCIDPSPHAYEIAKRVAAEAIQGMFPSEDITGRYDMIVHSDVLEHVPDPIEFLQHHHRFLHPTGTVVFAIPDCTESIRRGDVSMALHQHLSYFDYDSITAVLAKAGFVPSRIDRSRYTGSFLVAARPGGNDAPASTLFHEFSTRAERAVRRATAMMADHIRTRRVGFYVPLRALTYFPQAATNAVFMDDGMRGKYLFNRPVIGGADLASPEFAAQPLAMIFVASLTNANQIREKLGTYRVPVVTLNEVLGEVI